MPGAEIFGLSGRLRYDSDKHLYVRDLRLIEIQSLTPFDAWSHSPSWTAGTGLDTAYELGKPAYRSLVYEGRVGSGLSAAPWDGALLFAVAQLEGEAGSPLRDGFAAGGALRAGLIQDLGASLRVLLDGALSARPFGDRTPNNRLRLGVNYSPLRDFALKAEGLLRGPYREAGAYANLYY
jgi:hypothetical protein